MTLLNRRALGFVGSAFKGPVARLARSRGGRAGGVPTIVRMTQTAYETVPGVSPAERETGGGTVVMKFGGTSVADPEKIRAVAGRLVAAKRRGGRVVGVVSAMGQHTDELLELAHEVSPRPKPRELDMLISVGERISCALVAMAISDLGLEAISLTGSQAGIVTDTVHGKAKIVEVRARRIHEALDQDRIVLVAGFQGVSTTLDITTLGRGGTDHDRRGARRRPRRRPLRDLHGRRRRLHRRPAGRAGRTQAARGLVRGDARDGGVGREGPPATLGRVRAQPSGDAPRALDLPRGGRHVGPKGGRTDAREGDDLRGDAHRRGGRVRGARRRALPTSSRRSQTRP